MRARKSVLDKYIFDVFARIYVLWVMINLLIHCYVFILQKRNLPDSIIYQPVILHIFWGRWYRNHYELIMCVWMHTIVCIQLCCSNVHTLKLLFDWVLVGQAYSSVSIDYHSKFHCRNTYIFGWIILQLTPPKFDNSITLTHFNTIA